MFTFQVYLPTYMKNLMDNSSQSESLKVDVIFDIIA